MVCVKDYRHYLQCIKNWESHSAEERDELRKWYRNYYESHKEKEKERCKSYKRRKLSGGGIEAFLSKILRD